MPIFPEDFFWGAATSAHQVEGNNHNDWSEWEKENAEKLAQSAEKKFGHLTNWPEIKNQAQNPRNYISDRACDHYNRHEEDFDIAKSLNHNAHRFSIEWSRIEPEEGKWDEKEIEHYRKVIHALRARGMEPFVTLWHWTIPLWVRDIGGWENKKTINYFSRFTDKVVSSLGDDVNFWIILNEPNIYTSFGYIRGTQPPGIKSVIKACRVYFNLMSVQRDAYSVIHKSSKNARVGSSHSFIYFDLKNNFFVSKFFRFVADYFWNFWFVNNTSRYWDFIGCNYYTRNLIGTGSKKIKTGAVSDLGWEIFPEGIYLMLKKLKKYNKPVYITENGIADAKDEKRAHFIKEHLLCIGKAIKEGVDVRGYFYWSLLDNFEFVEGRGFWPRFGLVGVDYQTMKRTIRHSAQSYARIVAENGLKK